MIARPKRYSMLHILDWQFIIELKPQQIWECEIVHENDIQYKRKYRLSRDNVTLNFTEKEFKDNFNTVEQRKPILKKAAISLNNGKEQ